jgi:iron complex transport system ATP-binding protein
MIALENASVRFGTRTVLEKLSLTVPIGQSLAILGPNGRGKTTALKSMLGFQPLDEGRRVAPQIVGYVPQSASLNQRLSVRDVVVMGRAAHLGLFGQPDPEDFDAATRALEHVGIAGFANWMFDCLSGGERQLVLLARALATGSDILVLDEPAAALDLRNQERLLRLLVALKEERNRAIIFTTHDPNHAFAADQALLMMPGAETLCGPVKEMLTADHLERLYGVAMRHTIIKGADGQPRNAILPAFAGKEAA